MNTCPVDRQVYNFVLARRELDGVVDRRVSSSETNPSYKVVSENFVPVTV